MGGNTVIVTICVVYFLVMIGTGIYASRKNKKASDFLVAGRKLNAADDGNQPLRQFKSAWESCSAARPMATTKAYGPESITL